MERVMESAKSLTLYTSDEERREIVKEVKSLRFKDGERLIETPEEAVPLLMLILSMRNDKEAVLEIARKYWK
jgi:hypothetical protein